MYRSLIARIILPLALLILLANAVSAAPFNAITNIQTSNSTFIPGQSFTANIVVSGGSGGPYYSQLLWAGANMTDNYQVVNTISLLQFNGNPEPASMAVNPAGTIAYLPGYYISLGIANLVANTVTNIGGTYQAAAFSPSGSLAYVTNSGGTTVSVVNVASNTVTNTITVGSGPYGVALNPSGALAYVTNYNSNTVSVINTASNTVTNTIAVAINPEGISINPSGTLAYVTNSGSSSVSVIDTASNTVVNTITVGSDPNGVAFSLSGALAYVTNYNSNTVSVIDTASNTVTNTIAVAINPKGITFNPSGTLAYVPSYQSSLVDVINVATNTVIDTITPNANSKPISVAFGPSGSLAYVVTSQDLEAIGNLTESAVQQVPANDVANIAVNVISSNTIQFTVGSTHYTESTGSNTVYGKWTLSPFVEDSNSYYSQCGFCESQSNMGNTVISSPITFSVAPNSLIVTISPAPPTSIEVGQSFTANVMASRGSGGPYYGQFTWVGGQQVNNQVVNTIATGLNPHGIAISPSGTFAYVPNKGSDTVNVINVASNTVVETITVGSGPNGVDFSPSGSLAYVTNYNSNTVSVINVPTNTVTNTINMGSQPSAAAFNPSGSIAYVTNSGGGTVSVINVASNTVVNTITVGSTPQGIAFNSSGSIAYVTNSGGTTVSVVNVASNTVTKAITVGSGPYGLAFSPSGTTAYVTNSGSGTVSVINVPTNTVTNTITVGSGPYGVALNPSGTLAYVTNYNSNTVSVINTATSTSIGTISGLSSPIGVAFSPSGTLAYVTNSGGGTVSAIGNLPESAVIPFPSSGTMQIAVNAISTNTIAFTFNGVQYTEHTSVKESHDTWSLYFSAEDSNGYYEDCGTCGTPINMGNVAVNYTSFAVSSNVPFPLSLSIAPSAPSSLAVGKSFTTNMIVSGGSGGPYYSQLSWAGANMTNNNQVVNTISLLQFNGNPEPASMAVNPSGTIAYLMGYYIHLAIVNLATNTVAIGLTTSEQAAAFNPSGTLAYVTSGSSPTVSVLDVATNTVVNTITAGSGAYGIALNPSGSFAYVTNSGGGTVSVIDTASNTVVNTITVGSTPEGISINPSGTLAYVTNSGGGTVSVINLASNTVINTITVGSDPSEVTFTPSGTTAYVSNYNSGTVSVINVASNTVINTITVGSEPGGAAFNPAGTTAYVPSYQSYNISVINVASNTVINTIPPNQNARTVSVALSPSGSFVYVLTSQDFETIGNLTESTVQQVPTSNDAANITVNVISSNAIQFTLAGTNYTESTGSNTVYGKWTLSPFVEDSNSYYSQCGFCESQSNTGNVISNQSISFTVIAHKVIYASLSTNPTLPTALDVGQTETFTASATGGKSPYTYNFLVYNSITGSLVGNLLTSSNTFAYNIPSSQSGNTLDANVIVTDSASNSGNSILTGVLTVNSAQTAGTPTATNTVIDSGQSSTLAAHQSGGTSPITINWFSQANCAGSSIGTGNSITESPSSTTTYSYNSVDSAGTANVVCSSGTIITVNAAQTAGVPTESNTVIDSGQSSTLTSHQSGGTSPIAINWFSQANCAGSSIGTGSSLTESPSSTTTYSYNSVDSANTATVACSLSNTVTVNAALSVGTITPSSPAIDSGQSKTLTANPRGGTLPYTYSWYTASGSSSPLCTPANVIPSQSASTITVSPTTTNSYTYQVVDSASTNVIACSAADTVSVYPALRMIALTESNSSLDGDQYQFLTANIAGGTSPYTYNFTVYNSIGRLVHTYSVSNSFAANALLFQQAPSWGTGTFTANVIVTDSAYATASTSNTYAANPAFQQSSFTASNSIAVPPGYQTLSAAVTGGTSPYTYNFLVYNSIGNLMSNALFQSSYTSNTDTFFLPSTATWPSGTYTANIVETDSASFSSKVSSSLDFLVCNSIAFDSSFSNSVIDNGQYQIATVNVISCASPYTYNYMVYNPSGSLTYNDLFTSSAAQNSITIAASSTGVWTVNVIVSNQLPESFTRSLTYNVLTSPSVSVSPASVTLDNGQPLSLGSTASGGAAPYSYQWYESQGTVSCNSANAISGAVAETYANSPSSSGNYAVQITDSATTPVSACSSAAEVTVNTAQTAEAPTESNTVIDSGQSSTLTSHQSGGTSPITINWFTGGSCGGVSLGSGTVFAATPTYTTTYSYNAIDSASTANVVCSLSNTITVNPAQIAGTPTATNTVIDSGQSSTLAAHQSGGTSPITINWFSQANCAGSSIGTGSSLTESPSSTTTYSYNAVDSASSANAVCSPSTTITVNAALAAGVPTESKTSIDLGQFSTLTSHQSGGTLPITINWFADAGCSGSSFATGISTSVSPTSTTTYSYNAFDSATTANVVCSPSNTLTVSNAAKASISLNVGSITIGSSVTYTVTIPSDFGAGALTANVIANGALISTSTAYAGNSVSLSYTPPSAGTYDFYANVTDASTEYTSQSTTVTLIVNAKPNGPQVGSGGSVSGVPSNQPTSHQNGSNSASTTTSTPTSTTPPTTTQPSAPATTPASISPPTYVISKYAGQSPQLCSNKKESSFIVTYASIGSSFGAVVNGTGCYTINAVNATGAANVPPPPGSLTNIRTVNLTVSKGISAVNATLNYSCSLPAHSVAPYILANGTWNKIKSFTVDSATCTISFTIPSDPVLAVFANQTTIPPPSSPAAPAASNSLWAIAAVIVVIIAALLFALRRKKRRRFG